MVFRSSVTPSTSKLINTHNYEITEMIFRESNLRLTRSQTSEPLYYNFRKCQCFYGIADIKSLIVTIAGEFMSHASTSLESDKNHSQVSPMPILALLGSEKGSCLFYRYMLATDYSIFAVYIIFCLFTFNICCRFSLDSGERA